MSPQFLMLKLTTGRQLWVRPDDIVAVELPQTQNGTIVIHLRHGGEFAIHPIELSVLSDWLDNQAMS